MKLFPLLVVMFLSATYALNSTSYLNGTFLSLKEAKNKWGSLEFKASEFIKSFIPDDNLEKVKEIKIHKKCCYKSAF
jgi:hypothetical protein